MYHCLLVRAGASRVQTNHKQIHSVFVLHTMITQNDGR